MAMLFRLCMSQICLIERLQPRLMSRYVSVTVHEFADWGLGLAELGLQALKDKPMRYPHST